MWRTIDGKTAATYIVTLALWKIPKVQKEGSKKERLSQRKCLVLCGSCECPCMTKAKNPNFGGQENREEIADTDAEGDGGREPKENPGGDGHTLWEKQL